LHDASADESSGHAAFQKLEQSEHQKMQLKLPCEYLAIRDAAGLKKKTKGSEKTKGRKKEMKLEISVPVSGLDLANPARW